MPDLAPPPLKTGLLVLHGNRLELLADAVLGWLARHPLGALEQETLLVQSNGMAEWLKMQIASAQGVCAATRVELPARFIWRAYRAVLGKGAVPATSPLDKLPLTWRLMGLLPTLLQTPGFEPVAGFLADRTPGDAASTDGDPMRRLQLAQRLADLYDQYQVYRSDWLQDWADGTDQLRAPGGRAPNPDVPPDQQWQSALWRAALATLSADDKLATRPLLHQQFLHALTAHSAGPWPALPRRIVLFGTTHIPHQTLEAIAALSAHCQVLLAVPNPCRFHWADTIAGRDLLLAPRRRHALRGGRDLALLPLQDLHAHGHPLLAAWGRQARDFVRQLDAFDDAHTASRQFQAPRIDLFDDTPGLSLLGQVQANIRDLLPLAEHPAVVLAPDDRSIVFHAAHGAQREVEILHDQLLHLLAHPPRGNDGQAPALQPRDIVVMVPAIDSFAPAIRSVFGQFPRGHARHIPWGISDQQDRGHQPLLVALEWLLRAPQQRFAASELRALLDVPAVLRRAGIAAEDLPTLVAWLHGAGLRWGLHAEQRGTLGLQACGDINTWRFALQRMLLGYATGPLDEGFAGIEPHAEVAGLAAGLAGAMAEWADTLAGWWADCQTARTPAQWGERLRLLLQQVFAATDDTERGLLAALDDALSDWLQACDAAGFDADVDLPVVREAWLQAVDAPAVSRRFKAGGVTFCTLLPLRAIPFDLVCLLGMNDGDYPRRSLRSDFDLMGQPGQARPGDRSRRDDDRQLMLDALLSARRVLYISWAGRSQRDNQLQPPSVLVSQLQDYLTAGWGQGVVQQRTVQHPLQPFSRRYFEPAAAGAADDGSGLFTYASEWRTAHTDGTAAGLVSAAVSAPRTPTSTPARDGGLQLDIQQLATVLRNPVKAFFRHRLQVQFDVADDANDDDEAFATVGLQRWQLLDEALHAAQRQVGQGAHGHAMDALDDTALQAVVSAALARLQRAGRLPLGGPGALVQADLQQTLRPMLQAWQGVLLQHPLQHDKLAVLVEPTSEPTPEADGLWAADSADDAAVASTPVALHDWLVGLRSALPQQLPAEGAALWVDLLPGRIAADKKLHAARPERLLTAWLRCLASAAMGQPAAGVVIGTDAIAHIDAWRGASARDDAAQGGQDDPADSAHRVLCKLLQACRSGLLGSAPLPTAVRTGVRHLQDPARARGEYDGNDFGAPGEGSEPCLARLFPDHATLSATPGFDSATHRLYGAYADWLASHVRLQALPDAADGGGAQDD